MKLLKISFLCAVLLAAGHTYAWDRTRHDAIACIADRNLTRKARKNIARYLDHPIVYYASYMDKFRNTPEFRHIEHVGYVDERMRHIGSPEAGKTDCVTELVLAIDRLRNYCHLSDSLVRLNLMYVIHIVGDMHCPSHVKYPEVKSGRAVLNGRKMSYHAVWDWGVLQAAHGWSYTEYRQQLDTRSRREKAAMAAGTPEEWFRQSAIDCHVIYDWQTPGEELGKEFVNRTWLLPETQLLKAAYRLAAVLNDLFG